MTHEVSVPVDRDESRGESVVAVDSGSAAELEALCAPRVQPRTEIFPQNAWYGAARAIQDYCGWPSRRPLPITLPHGLDLSAAGVCPYEARSPLPAVYSFPHYRDDAYRVGMDRIVVPGCAPWLFLDHTTSGPVAERRFVMMMPAHSSLDARAELDHARFAASVENEHPGASLLCCMYWRDVQHGHHEVYLKRGIPVTSAGHVYDTGFMHRLAGLFSRTRLMVTNEFGSHVFYAASVGVPVFVRGDVDVAWIEADDPVPRPYDNTRNAPEFTAIEPLFREPAPDLHAQRVAAEMMLGAERKFTPEALRETLEALWRRPGFRSRARLRWQLGTLVRRTVTG